MYSRIKNSLIAFGAVVVAYQAYALVATPLLEPPERDASTRSATEQEWQGGRQAVARYQQLVRGYFSADHWTQQGTPIFIEYGQVLLALGDYEADDQGRVDLKQCAVIVFPTPRIEAMQPPRDAIVVEAERGARLQFDDAFDPMSGSVGRPVAGYFPGEMIVRSDMKEPGPGDDLRVVTRDIRFNQAMMHTDADVSFQMGPHAGGGRRLEVRFVRDADPGRRDNALPVAGASSLEIRDGVWAHLQLDSKTGPAGGLRSAPMRLTSQGPFGFDFTKFVASFEQRVIAEQPNPDGTSDRMLCDELRLHFSDGDAPTVLTPEDEPELARTQGRLLGRLTPHLLEAVGAPVRVESPARGAVVQSEALRYWIGERRMRIEGAPAVMAQGLNEVRSAWIEYTLPPEGSQRALGELAVAGPGWVQLAPDRGGAERPFQARWGATPPGQPAVALTRDRQGNPLLSVVGRPEIAAGGVGTLSADRIVTQLREVAPDGPEGSAIEISSGEGTAKAILLQRIDAIGSVEMIGREVHGRADTLVAWFRPLTPDEIAIEQEQEGTRRPWQPETDSPESDRRFLLGTRSLQLEIGYAGRRLEPISLVCSGGVQLEKPVSEPGEEPLRVIGRRLRAEGIHRPGGVRLTVAGGETAAAPGAATTEGLAEVQSGGTRLWVRDLHLDQAARRIWTEGRGDARVRLTGATGPLGPAGSEASLRWTDGLEFDGAQIVLSGDVFAESAHDLLHCRSMTARLSKPIDLAGSQGASAEGVEIASVECAGGVTIDHRSVDELGQKSHEHARLESLAIDQISGDIRGQGPGWIRSIHLAGASSGLGFGGNGAQQPTSQRGLRFLRVDFRRGLAGNLHRRAVRFQQDVQAVYGPVLAWDHELPLRSPQGPPPDVVEMSCDELRAHEDPATLGQRRAPGQTIGPIELRALGSVRIDAAGGQRGGTLAAEAAAASYSQAADRFTLEGDGQRLATLWVQTDPSQPPMPSSAQRLIHYRSEGRTKIEDLRGIQYRPAPRSATPGLPLGR